MTVRPVFLILRPNFERLDGAARIALGLVIQA